MYIVRNCINTGQTDMKKYDIVFEVLHYLAFDATVKSVDYIKKNIDTEEYLIVITDNGSPDDSGERLKEKYEGDDKVRVLKTGSNLGFTRGNNHGIAYIRENCDFDFMVVMNNDVMLIEGALVHKLRSYADKYPFAAAGPNVVDKYGVTYNPVARELPSMKLIKERIDGANKLLKYDRFGLLTPFTAVSYTGFRIKRFLKGESRRPYEKDVCTDVILHGCFWIFSRAYFEKCKGLADKEFMYGEEETLGLYLKKKGLMSLYMPDVTVLHLHAEASDMAFKKEADKLRFSAQNKSRSWLEYIELMNEEGEENE